MARVPPDVRPRDEQLRNERPGVRPSHLRRVPDLVAQGLTNQEIADLLEISPHTVAKIRQGRYRKKPRVGFCPVHRCHVYLPCEQCRMERSRSTQSRSNSADVAGPQSASSIAEALLRGVETIGLPAAESQALRRRGIRTVGQLLEQSRDALLDLLADRPRGANRAEESLMRIYDRLERLGFVRRSRRTRAA